jgi:hypothetical protein
MSDKPTDLASVPFRRITRSRDELNAEHTDPFAMGWEAGENLDDPPANPYENGTSARLWRMGFSARVDDYISKTKRAGLATSLT